MSDSNFCLNCLIIPAIAILFCGFFVVMLFSDNHNQHLCENLTGLSPPIGIFAKSYQVQYQYIDDGKFNCCWYEIVYNNSFYEKVKVCEGYEK